MKILMIGGTHFIGPPVVRQLTAMGHEVSVFHRGKTEAELPSDVHHLLGDRIHPRKFRTGRHLNCWAMQLKMQF